jgi:hypothetical protein
MIMVRIGDLLVARAPFAEIMPFDDAGKLKYETGFERYGVLNPGTDKERIRVWLADGTYDDCDLLIGADGSYSKVRGITPTYRTVDVGEMEKKGKKIPGGRDLVTCSHRKTAETR